MSFYRIYRPRVFADVDNLSVQKTLQSMLTKARETLPHAYLFSGPRGTGKTTAARLVAKLFNCLTPNKQGEPCGNCSICLGIAQGNMLDVLEIDAASNTGVDNIRDLRDKIMLAPSEAKWKVYIIDEVHMLSTGAFNALLKTLEEPPAHAIFILATTDLHKVPATIQSRCMMVAFSRPQIAEIVGALQRIVKEEKIDIDALALERIASVADGSFRDAVKLLEQVSLNTGKITLDVVASLLSLTASGLEEQFIRVIAQNDLHGALDIVETLVHDGKDSRIFLQHVLQQLEQILLAIAQGKTVSGWTFDQIKQCIGRFNRAYGEMRTTAIVQLPLELAIIEYMTAVSEKAQLPVIATPVRPTVTTHVQTLTPHMEQKTVAAPVPVAPLETESSNSGTVLGLITKERLLECWKDIIDDVKNTNHSIAGILRSTRPKSVSNDIVTIEAFYLFHKEKLSESKTKEMLSATLKKLFGETIKVDIVLGKK